MCDAIGLWVRGTQEERRLRERIKLRQKKVGREEAENLERCFIISSLCSSTVTLLFLFFFVMCQRDMCVTPTPLIL